MKTPTPTKGLRSCEPYEETKNANPPSETVERDLTSPVPARKAIARKVSQFDFPFPTFSGSSAGARTPFPQFPSQSSLALPKQVSPAEPPDEWRTSYRGRRQFVVKVDQLCVQRAAQPKVVCVVGGEACRLGQLNRRRVVHRDGFHPQPVRKPEGRAQSTPLARISPNFLVKQTMASSKSSTAGAASRAPSNRPTTVSASGSANRTAGER